MGVPLPFPPSNTWRELLEFALAEDVRSGDVTSRVVIDPGRRGRAVIEARQDLVVCGLKIAGAVFTELDPSLAQEPLCVDGERVARGASLLRLEGSLHSILAGERTALNFLGRLCGIATLTQRFVERVADTGVRIVDTRKTLPGWRVLDKYAVATGGGVNHRVALDDAILIKDNHIAAAGGVELAVKAAKAGAPPHLHIQVEVESLDSARQALEAGADSLLLDNRSPAELREIAHALGDRTVLEASGGITEADLREVAETGVHRISLGVLTHSAPVADVALELEAEPAGGVTA